MVLIENVLAAFEMEEILYELREHSAGLNCGIWDYSASFVNKFGEPNILSIFHWASEPNHCLKEGPGPTVLQVVAGLTCFN